MMCPRVLSSLVVLIFVSAATNVACAASGDFAVRVSEAKDIEDRGKYKDYFSVYNSEMGSQLQKVMVVCFPKAVKRDTDKFILVADVTSEGKAASVAVQPQTDGTKCVTEKFRNFSFPKPPSVPNHKDFPIYIEMSIKD